MKAPHPDALPLWVVYHYPADYPLHYVLRVVWVIPGFVMAAYTGCLYDRWEEVQFEIESFGLRHIGRDKFDDPAILGVWV